MLRSKKLSFRLVPASAMLAIAAVCWSPVASAGALTMYLNTTLGVDTTTSITNNDRQAYWMPKAAGVAYEAVDNENGVLRTGAGYGGQPYDLEALYVQKSGANLIITGVAGANTNQIPKGLCEGSGVCSLPSGTPNTYGMGDFFLGSLSGTIYSPKIGLETTGQNFTMDGSGHANGYTTKLKAGDLVGLKGSVNYTLSATNTPCYPTNNSDCAIKDVAGWETGLPNWHNFPAPSQIATTGYTPNNSGASAVMQYEQIGTSNHYIYQATITNFASLGLGNEFTVHWGEICGNDFLRTTANVPLPSSLALFLLGGAGLAAGTRRRRV